MTTTTRPSEVEAPRCGGVTVAPRSGTTRERHQYWHRFIRLGFAIFFAESALGYLYYELTPTGSHRGILKAIGLACMAVTAAGFFCARALSRPANRELFAFLTILGATAIVGVTAGLDGGIDSPLLKLLVLPMMASTFALPARRVAACGLAAVATATLDGLVDKDIVHSPGRVVLLAALLVGVTVLTTGTSIARRALEGEESKLMGALAVAAATDSLTGCANHGAFYSTLQTEIDRAARYRTDLSLIVGDVDLFKSYNDRHGHDRGDEQLVRVAAVLRSSARELDTVARIGGDEFAIIVPSTSLAAAESLGHRIATALRADEKIAVTVSFGVGSLNLSEPTLARLFRDADAALYEAKALGRDRVRAERTARRDAVTEGVGDGRAEDEALVRDQLLAIQRQLDESASIAVELLRAVPAGICFIDRTYRVLQVNPALAAMTGSAAESLVGRPLDGAFPGEWRTLAPLVREVIQGGTTQRVEVPIHAGEGAPKVFGVHVFPIRLDDEVIGAGTVMVDVSAARNDAEAQRVTSERVVAALAATSEMRDPYTAGHQARVAEIARAIASEMGIDELHVERIGLAARIHDIGKVGVPSEILVKPGRLTPAEMALVRAHTVMGYELLRQVGFPEELAEIVRHHHERLDGSGYPDGLRGDAVSIGARIVAVSDVADAVASRRPYREAQGVASALRVLADESTSRLDPRVVAVFVRLLDAGRIALNGDGREDRRGGDARLAPRPHGRRRARETRG